MNLQFPLEIYFDQSSRENYFKREKILKGMSANYEESIERFVKKGDIILIFNDSQDETIEWKTQEEEIKTLAEQVSAQGLIDLA